MAENVSSRVQYPIIKSTICQLCDKEATVKWKCITCDEAMCISCKTTHLRSKLGSKHEVLEIIKTEKSNLSASVDPTTCTDHPKENVNMYCVDCSTLVCPDCLTGKHNKHSLSKISNIANEKQQELEKCLTQAERKLDGYQTTMQQIQRNQTEYEKDSTTVTKQLQKRRDELKHEVDQVTDEMLREFEIRKKRDKDKIKTMEEQLKNSISTTKDEIKAFREEINSMGDIKKIRSCQAMKQNLDDYKENTQYESIQAPKFVSNMFTSKAALKNLIGQMDEKDEKREDLQHKAANPGEITNVQLVSTFDCPEGKTFNLVRPVNPNKAWFARYTQPDVYLISTSGQVEKVVQTDFDIFQAAVNKSEELFVISDKNNKLKRLTFDKFVDIHIPSLTHVSSIYFTSNSEILVSGIDTKDKHCKIVRLSPDYKVLQTICTDPVTNKQLFDLPAFLTQSTNGNIYITNNIQENKTQNIIAIDRTGHHIFTYPTAGSVKLDKQVIVGVITEDKHNNILVRDINNCCIHVLDRNGKFKQFLDTKQHGLEIPKGVTTDTSGNIWIYGQKDSKTLQIRVIIINY